MNIRFKVSGMALGTTGRHFVNKPNVRPKSVVLLIIFTMQVAVAFLCLNCLFLVLGFTGCSAG